MYTLPISSRGTAASVNTLKEYNCVFWIWLSLKLKCIISVREKWRRDWLQASFNKASNLKLQIFTDTVDVVADSMNFAVDGIYRTPFWSLKFSIISITIFVLLQKMMTLRWEGEVLIYELMLAIMVSKVHRYCLISANIQIKKQNFTHQRWKCKFCWLVQL